MLKTISGSYDLIPDSSWMDIQTEEIRLVCDTSSAPVVVNLPAISAISGGTLNVKIYVVDGAGNAGSNNIIINASGGNGIGASSSYTISQNDGGAYIQIGSPTKWLLTPNSVISGGGGTFDTFTEIEVDFSMGEYHVEEFGSANLGKVYGELEMTSAVPFTGLKRVLFPKLKQLTDGIYIDATNLTSLDTLNFSALESALTFEIEQFDALTSLNLSKLYNNISLDLAPYTINGVIPIDAVVLTNLLVCQSVNLSALEYTLENVNISGLTIATSIDISKLKQVGGLVRLSDTPACIVSIPKLEQATLRISNVANTTFIAPLFVGNDTAGFGGGVQTQGYKIDTNALLTSISLPEYIGDDSGNWIYQIDTNPALTSVSIPKHIKFGNTKTLEIRGNAVLTTITVAPSIDLLVGLFDGNALDNATMNAILTSVIAGSNIATVNLDFTGGTNAAPDVAGLALIATITGAGGTVTTN